MPRTVIVVQARMGSSRLPGKVLKTLAGLPGVEHVLSRVALASRADMVCLATSDERQDDALSDFVLSLGYHVSRGSHKDVLSRFCHAARETGADFIVRITADCPLVDPEVINSLIKLRENSRADYASNGLILDWPDGLDCEIFTKEVLFKAEVMTSVPYDREHVTPWIRREGASVLAHLSGPGMPQADQRWTLDSPEDFDFLENLFSLIPNPPNFPNWQHIMRVVEAHPDLCEINFAQRRKELPA